jgi:hypothetical protein
MISDRKQASFSHGEGNIGRSWRHACGPEAGPELALEIGGRSRQVNDARNERWNGYVTIWEMLQANVLNEETARWDRLFELIQAMNDRVVRRMCERGLDFYGKVASRKIMACAGPAPRLRAGRTDAEDVDQDEQLGGERRQCPWRYGDIRGRLEKPPPTI